MWEALPPPLDGTCLFVWKHCSSTAYQPEFFRKSTDLQLYYTKKKDFWKDIHVVDPKI